MPNLYLLFAALAFLTSAAVTHFILRNPQLVKWISFYLNDQISTTPRHDRAGAVLPILLKTLLVGLTICAVTLYFSGIKTPKQLLDYMKFGVIVVDFKP